MSSFRERLQAPTDPRAARARLPRPPYGAASYAPALVSAIRYWFVTRVEPLAGNYALIGAERNPTRTPTPTRTLAEDFTKFSGRPAPDNMAEWVQCLASQRGWSVRRRCTHQHRLHCLIGVRLIGEPEFDGNDRDATAHHPRWLKKGIPLEEAKRIHSAQRAQRYRDAPPAAKAAKLAYQRQYYRRTRQAAQQTPSPSPSETPA